MVYWSGVWVGPKIRAEGTKGGQSLLHTTMTSLVAYFSVYFTFHPIVLLNRASDLQVEAVNGGRGGVGVGGRGCLRCLAHLISTYTYYMFTD